MNAAIYARFSSDHQRTESIDAQIRKCKEYALKNKMNIVKIYVDKALSGTKDNRQGFQQMIADSNLNIFEAVLCHKVDRFSRNTYDYNVYKHKLKLNDVNLIFVDQEFSDSPESILMENMLVGLADYYSQNLAKEVMKGMKENAYNCKFNGGYVLFGYSIDNNKNYIINKNEAKAVKYIFEQYTSGNTYANIIKWLTMHGYKTRKNKLFSNAAIREMLKNERYTGIYIFNEKTKKRKSKKTDEIIKIEGGIPQIIDKNLFEKVKNRMNECKKNGGMNYSKECYLLSGKILCGQCEHAMIGHRKSGGKNKNITSVYYECDGKRKYGKIFCTARSIKKDIIENEILLKLENEIFNDSYIEFLADKVYNEIAKRTQNNKNNLKQLQLSLNKVKAQINNIVDAVANGLFHESMKSRMDELEEQKAQIITQMAKEHTESELHYTKEQITEYLQIGKYITKKSKEEQKKIIHTYVDKIVVNPDNIDVYVKLTKVDSSVSSGRRNRTADTTGMNRML